MLLVALLCVAGSTAFGMARGLPTAGFRRMLLTNVRPVCMAPWRSEPSPEERKKVKKNKEQVKDFIRRRQGSAQPQQAPSNPPMPLTSSSISLRFHAVAEQQQLSALEV